MRPKHLVWLVLVVLIVVPGLVLAKEAQKNIVVAAGTIVDDNFVGFGETITIEGEISGDAMVFGTTVTIADTAVIHGDLLSAGQTIRVNGTVEGNIRAAGETITIDSAIGKNASVAGETVTVTDDGVVGWSLQAAGNTVNVDGEVKGQANLYAATASVTGTIGGNTIARVSQITVSNSASLGGNLTYSSEQPGQIASGAVKGTVLREAATHPTDNWEKFANRFRPFALFVSVAGLLIVGLILRTLFPTWSHRVVGTMWQQPSRSMLIGIGILLLVPPLVLVSFFTIVGLPLGFIALALYLVGLYVSRVFTGWVMAGWLLKKLKITNWPEWLVMSLGTLLVIVLGWLPVVGPLLTAIAIIWGLGGFWPHKADAAKA